MPFESFEPRAVPEIPHALDDGPVLECAPPGSDVGDHSLRIRARRSYPVSREDLFAAWTRRTSWECWMRLRARSRATLAPCHGGAFRVELAEGPMIHVITGAVNEIRPHELISFTWIHHNTGDHGSVVDVAFRQRHDETQLTLLHGNIGSRREASWLMRLWGTVLGRLTGYVTEGMKPSARPIAGAAVEIVQTSALPVRRSRVGGVFARSAGIAFALAAVPLHNAAAQAPDSARAASHYAAGRWSEAAQAYSALARRDTTSVMNWYRYGVALDELGRHADAVGALRRALSAPAPFVNQVHYRLAKAYAGAAAQDSAFAHLESAAAGGFRLWEAVRDDRDFAPMRNDARFTRALARLENNRFPCRQRPVSRQLDYWVGDWNVVNGTTQLGTNKVELVNGDCVVQENWMSNGAGGGGKSWSYYDPPTQKWRQIFIFDNGGTWDFTGELHDGAMRFERPLPAVGNTPAGIQRMTYFPIAKDSVRQYIESTTDGGKTWTPGFDGMYVRKPAGAR